jgi:crotonobetainyl-CoA:carnitine CoA-transferase CaiB-like acyl-CoA transferase
MSMPLQGITVIDFTNNGAGPCCSMLLGDFGAEIIKVEPPGGDATRHWGSARMGARGEFTPTYISLNRNKYGIVLDLKSAEGKEAARELIGRADVVIESFSPGVAERLGIGYKDVCAKRPEIVYCSVSGFGQSGPLSKRPGFDMLLQAYCGHMSITGEKDRPSVRNGPSSIDYLTGAHAAFGIMLALRHRDRTGKGQQVDSCLFDNAIYLVSNHLTDSMATKRIPQKMGSDFALLAPYGVFMAKDREFYIGISSDAMWQGFCDAIGRKSWATDPSFLHNADRLKNRQMMQDLLRDVFVERNAQEWIDIAVRLGIPNSLVRNLAEVAEDEHLAARGLLYDSGIDGVKTVGTPFKLSLTPGTPRKRAPALDEDRAYILDPMKAKSATRTT